MAFSFTQTSITARTAAVAAHNRGLDNGLQGTTGVGQCGIFGPAPPREPTPSAPIVVMIVVDMISIGLTPSNRIMSILPSSAGADGGFSW